MTYPRFLLSLTFASALFAQTPRILFSDLDSGPKTGGENNLGVYVTIYGSNFGSVRGNSIVIIGGGAAANYPVWTDSKVTFQVGGAAASGEIRIQTGGGVSNGVPFTVRTGGIFFVSTSGSDANTGATGAPWRTVQWAVDHVAAGDTIYLTNGVVETRLGTSDGSVSISRNFGAAGAPKALIGYPGAVATIGSTGSAPCTTTGCFEGIKTIYASDYWTVAGLRLVGNDYGIVVRGANWRVIGNELTCPWGNGASACLDGTQATNVKVWGNNIHDAGYYRGPKDQSSDLYHGIYFSTDSNLLDIGWNRVENVKGCRGIQIHSSRIDNNSGFNQYGISIHDNVIRNTQCDGIVLATIDPSRGAITIFNNLIVNAGQGPITFEGGGNFACIYAAGYTNAGPQGAGVVDIYNNTMVNCGNSSVPGGSSAVAYARRTTTIDVRLRNNILYQTNGAPYIIAYDGAQGIIGSNNLFYGNGAAPSTFPNLSGSLTGDPRFANPAGDFHLVSGSPARGTGLDTGLATDIEGKARSAPHDLGAYAGIGQPGVAPPAAVPGFSLSANPSSITLSEGASAITTTVTLIPVNGFSGTAQLTCQQTPAALSCFNASVSPGQPVTLTLSFPGLRTGTYPITIFGQSGSTASVTSLTLIIQAAPSGGFGGGGTGGLGGGVTPTTPTAGVRSITVRPASGWARANYGLISLTDFRFDLRVHDIQPQSSGRGVLFQTDSPYIGGLGIRTLGQTTRIEAIGLPDDNPSAPACAVEFQETDAVIRFQRAGSQFSLRVYDRTGTTELPGSVGPCWYRSINADGVGSLALGADLGGNGRSAFSIAYLRLFPSASSAAPGAQGVFNPVLNYEFEDNLLSTPASLAAALQWQTSDQASYENTPGVATTIIGPAVAGGSFDLYSTAVTVTTDSRTATSTLTLIPRANLANDRQVAITCVSPPSGVTCGIAYPSGVYPATLSLSLDSTVQPGTYSITLFGQAGAASGSGRLSLTVLPGSDNSGGSFAGNFGNRSIVVSPQQGWAAAAYPSPVNTGDFRLEMRIHALEAASGTLVRTLSNSGEQLGSLVASREGDYIQIRAVDLPGDFGGSYDCSVLLTTSQATDFVVRFQRAGRQYSLRTWNSTGLRENAAPASAPFCLLSQYSGGQVSGVTLGGPGPSGQGSAAFQAAWLRLYSVSIAVTPGGRPAPSAIFTYEFENSLTSGTAVAEFEWTSDRPATYITTPN